MLVYINISCIFTSELKQIENMRTAVVYITDKSEKRYFTEFTGEAFIDSSKRDLQRHLENAKLNPKAYSFLDLETAKIETELR